MESLKRLSLALAALTMGAVACGDDDDSNVTQPNLDASTADAARNGDAGDASGFACASYTAPAGNMCGGSHCLETPTQLKADVKAGAACAKEQEIDQFCSLSSVAVVKTCVLGAYANASKDLRADTTTCAAAMLPDYSAGCLSCFVESAACAAEKCISVCVPSDATPACDACRVQMGCIPSFYTCAGIKNPIPGF